MSAFVFIVRCNFANEVILRSILGYVEIILLVELRYIIVRID